MRILEANEFFVVKHSPRGDLGFDLLGTLADEEWAIEVKYYRTARVQPSLVEKAANRLLKNGVEANARRGMLVISSSLTPELRLALEERYGIVFVDRTDLSIWASKIPKLLAELESLLESDPIEVTSKTWEDPKRRRIPLSATKWIEQLDEGDELCKELSKIDKGKEGWAMYEDVCARILRYLFPNDLNGWHKQKRTDDGLNRFDFICRIHSTNEFWRFLIEHLDSRYVLFEFKNYRKKIKQGQVLTTEKYLLTRGLRRVAIILTRVGPDKGAIKMTQGAMREHGKLMLILDDSKVCEMLHKKDSGEDPADVLFEIADDFLLTLPR